MATPFISLFPGQGSQFPGMSKTLLTHFGYTRALFEEASDSIKESLTALTLEGPEDKLQLTANSQPAILTTSYAWLEVLRRELGYQPSAAAGHSLGEYTALLAAGALTLSEAVTLVRTRGTLMQNAVPEGKGKMAAVLGLDDSKIIELCEKASDGGYVVVPANFNAPGQVVISGHREAVERAEKLGSTEPLKARKMIPLKVSAPFHSPLMKAIVEPFTVSLKKVNWQPLQFRIAFNVDAKLREDANIIELLQSQLYSPVRWTECASVLGEKVGKTFVEVGPGKVLTGLVKRIVDGATLYSIDSIEDFKNFETKWKENV
jgi:[acyl-carrier-protein] S-malonyltransferase